MASDGRSDGRKEKYAGVLCMKKVFQDEDGVFQSS